VPKDDDTKGRGGETSSSSKGKKDSSHVLRKDPPFLPNSAKQQLRHKKKKAANAKKNFLTLPDTRTTIDSKAMAGSAGRTDTPHRKHPSLEFFPSFLPSPCAVATTTMIPQLTCGSCSRHSFLLQWGFFFSFFLFLGGEFSQPREKKKQKEGAKGA
jgi:hypothetical protein